jgi:hypothetical protein
MLPVKHTTLYPPAYAERTPFTASSEPFLISLSNQLIVAFMDDLTMAGDLLSVTAVVNRLILFLHKELITVCSLTLQMRTNKR